MMTREAFDQRQVELRCRFCQAVGVLKVEHGPFEGDERGVRCSACGRHNYWLKKTRPVEDVEF
jgi:hypothetical protein